MKTTNPTKFYIYCRKSSEAEDRQVLSIESQTKELQRLADKLNLKVVEVLSESQSAKEPGRPIFNDLMKKIYQGEAQGVLCWKLDRLARNPIDGGSVIWAMKQNSLEIITPTQTYSKDDDNLILMYIEFGMAQKYIDDLSRNVKRGNRTKLEKGEWLGVAPTGYLNDKATKTTVIDPERAPIVRKLWDLMLTGKYSVNEILDIANNKLKFRTRPTKRQGNKPLCLSALYKIFTNPFYFGLMIRSEGEFKGNHPPIITQEEFFRVQKILKRPYKYQNHLNEFAFRGLIKCAECGCFITAEHKINRYGYHYIYYHCTKRKREVKCSQKCVEVKDLENQISKYLNKVTISEGRLNRAILYLNKMHENEVSERTSLYKSYQEQYNECQTKIDNLLQLKIAPDNLDGSLLSNSEYIEQKDALRAKLGALKEKLEDTEHRAARWLELSERFFLFVKYAPAWFAQGSLDDKRLILESLGQNLVLDNKKLHILSKNPLKILEGSTKIPNWLSVLNKIRTFFRENPDAEF